MSRHDDETQEVPTGEHAKLTSPQRSTLMSYYRSRRTLLSATKERIDRQLKSGAWARSEIASESLSKDMREYSTVYDEVDRLTRLLHEMGVNGEI